MPDNAYTPSVPNVHQYSMKRVLRRDSVRKPEVVVLAWIHDLANHLGLGFVR